MHENDTTTHTKYHSKSDLSISSNDILNKQQKVIQYFRQGVGQFVLN